MAAPRCAVRQWGAVVMVVRPWVAERPDYQFPQCAAFAVVMVVRPWVAGLLLGGATAVPE